MLVIRMQRTGRKGHAMFRVVVQDSRLTPTSGKVVARLGSYDPHSKSVTLNEEKAAFYLEHGAQPSPRVTRLLKSEGVKLPDWAKLPANKERAVRNADKRRSTRPPESEAPASKAETPAGEVAEEVPAEPKEAAVKEEKPAETADAPEEKLTETSEKPEVEEKPAATEEAEKPEAEAVAETTETAPKTDGEAVAEQPKKTT